MNGNFSNGGVDTFDLAKRWIGIRLQQGVPLLDRDWNELEDIRRYFEWTLRRHYIGDGAPDADGFAVTAAGFRVERDVLVGRGRYCVAGYDLWLDDDALLSELRGGELLPAVAADGDELVVFVEPRVTRVTAEDDPALGNPQDINLETCVRDRLDPVFGVLAGTEALPPGAAALARIRRPAGASQVTAAMIEDLRTVGVSLAASVRSFEAFRHETLDALQRALEAIERIEQDLATLLWVVDVSAASSSLLFGSATTITITVRNRRNEPVSGASVSLSTDFGSLSPSRATTNVAGRVSFELLGVEADYHPPVGHVGLLKSASQRVKQATEVSVGSIDYSLVKFEPSEMAAVSRYLPTHALADLAPEVPLRPIVERPPDRTATVTVHATEPGGTIVRGTGSVQVTFGMWVRLWALDSIREVVSKVAVDARVGSAVHAGVEEGGLNTDLVATKLPHVLEDIHLETEDAIKHSVFVDPDPPRDLMQGVGRLGQSIAQESAAAVGSQVDVSIGRQVGLLAASPDVQLSAADAARAQVTIGSNAAAVSAGFTQQLKQRFNATRAVG